MWQPRIYRVHLGKVADVYKMGRADSPGARWVNCSNASSPSKFYVHGDDRLLALSPRDNPVYHAGIIRAVGPRKNKEMLRIVCYETKMLRERHRWGLQTTAGRSFEQEHDNDQIRKPISHP